MRNQEPKIINEGYIKKGGLNPSLPKVTPPPPPAPKPKK